MSILYKKFKFFKKGVYCSYEEGATTRNYFYV